MVFQYEIGLLGGGNQTPAAVFQDKFGEPPCAPALLHHIARDGHIDFGISSGKEVGGTVGESPRRNICQFIRAQHLRALFHIDHNGDVGLFNVNGVDSAVGDCRKGIFRHIGIGPIACVVDCLHQTLCSCTESQCQHKQENR